MALLKFIAYCICAYGLCNMIIFANGPFGIFKKWRRITHIIHPSFGELFTCPICLSTWCGLFFSAVNIWLVPMVAFTPFNVIFGVGNNIWLTLLMDMGMTSGVVWLLHQLEEMMERVGNVEYVDEVTQADIEED